MIVVANRIKVAKGYEEMFESRFRDRESLLSRLPGFVRNEVLRPVKGDYYVVKTYWRSMADFEAWTKSDEFRKAHANPPPKEAFAGPNQLEIHEVFSLHEAPVKDEGTMESRPDPSTETLLKAVNTLRKEVDKAKGEVAEMKDKLGTVEARVTRQERRGKR